MTTTSSKKTALHHKFHPPMAKVAKDKPSFDELVLQVTVGGKTEQAVRSAFIQLAFTLSGIAGVCFLKRNVEDIWTLSRDSPSSGRLPKWGEFVELMSEKCESIAQGSSVQTETITPDGLQGLLAPIHRRGGESEIMMLVVASQKDAILATAPMQKISAALELWLNSRSAADSDWQVYALAAIVELVGKLEKQKNLKSAAEETANLLANRLSCNSVVVGLEKHGRMKVAAVSGVSKLDRGSESGINYLQTLVESSTRREPALFPATDVDNNHLLQAHKQLAGTTHAEAVFSQPLITSDDEVFGAIVFTGPKASFDSTQIQRFSDAAAPAITSALQVVSKVRQNWIARIFSIVGRFLYQARTMLVGLGVAALVALMFLPVTYRVRCNCLAEPVSRRFAVAPFDGQIMFGHAEAGDFVKAGDLLAEMDGRTINWELAGVTAELKQSIRTREIELKERNIASTVVSQLERKRLASEESILKYKKDNLQIRSPIDGVVLSGSLERSEAASVTTGQVLFEIGPVDPLRIEIEIPDDEIAQVSVGYPVKVWIDGQEDDPFTAEIHKIHPRSETRNADNVFIAEIEFANDDERLRPGMKGSARIDCEQRSLGWSLFHKPINWVRSQLTWW